MKWGPLLLFLLMGCGKISSTNSSFTLREQRSYSPLIASADVKAELAVICNALAAKVNVLPQVLGSSFVFSLSTKSCEQSQLQAPQDVEVVIQRPVSNYVFKVKSSGLDFIYADVETPTSGQLGELCQRYANTLSPITNPFMLSNGNAVWFSIGNFSECSPTTAERCVQLETGAADGAQFKIHTKEWIKVRTDANYSRVGFFSQRTTISSSICGINGYTENKAVLK
ncbi:MAG: hypothetical protein AB7I27_01335 [Bacteriovoracaceae bacterium]